MPLQRAPCQLPSRNLHALARQPQRCTQPRLSSESDVVGGTHVFAFCYAPIGRSSGVFQSESRRTCARPGKRPRSNISCTRTASARAPARDRSPCPRTGTRRHHPRALAIAPVRAQSRQEIQALGGDSCPNMSWEHCRIDLNDVLRKVTMSDTVRMPAIVRTRRVGAHSPKYLSAI